MIRIILLGRTGNNLFQYALGRVLSDKHDVPLVMDASWFNRQGWREVSHFLRLPLRARIIRDPTPLSRALHKVAGVHRWQFGPFPFLAESPTNHAFDASFLDAPANCVLFGYFQSHRYFESIADDLRIEINNMLEHALGAPSGDIGDTLCDPRSVAVHVRRGDFLQHPAFQVCGDAYYHKAMNTMREKLEDARFLIFSDDPDWCRRNFKEPDTRVMENRDASGNPLRDLLLMSLARHHIIANSSYSWWAAWLGKRPGQRVITPARWFASEVSAPMCDKLCTGWVPCDADDQTNNPTA